MHFEGVYGDECGKPVCRSYGGGECGVPMLGVVVTVAVPGGGGGAEAAEDPSTAWRRPGAEAGAGRGT